MMMSWLHILIVVCTGCASSVAFKVVDVETGAPLQGVKIIHVEENVQYFSRLPGSKSEAGPTGENGMIDLGVLRSGFAHYFTLSAPGYRDAHVLAGSRGGWSPVNYSSPRPGEKIWSDIREIHRRDGVFIIPMHQIE